MKKNEPNKTHGNKRSVRLMENGDWSIPFSCCFVMKTMKEYLADECSMTVLFTMIMRIKLTGLPEMQTIMEFCTKERPGDENYSHEAVFG